MYMEKTVTLKQTNTQFEYCGKLWEASLIVSNMSYCQRRLHWGRFEAASEMSEKDQLFFYGKVCWETDGPWGDWQ